MNLLNFARMYWQLKDYNFKGSSVHIINIPKGHILPYSIIWRTRSLKSECFLSVQEKFHQHYHFRNQHVPIYHPVGIFFHTFLWECWALIWSPSSWFLLDLLTLGLKNKVKSQNSCNVDVVIPILTASLAYFFLTSTYPGSSRNNKKKALNIF